MRPLALFHASRPVPAEHRSNFRHLYLDVAWFGMLAASSLSFVGVYAARLGGTALQLGLLSMGPALANLTFALPAGRWLERQKMDAAVFWTAVFHRAFYLVWIFLPFFLGAQGQIWALVGLTLVMHIPGTAVAIGFNALFAEAVPPEWRGHVAGVRNALLSVAFIAISLICGQILQRMDFPIGYQVVFVIGFVGAAMSTYHLWFIVPHRDGQKGPLAGRGLGKLVWRSGPANRKTDRSAQAGQGHRLHLPRSEVLRGSYGKLIAVLFGFHLALYLSIPLFPVHWVNNLGLTDGQIGLGTAVFYVSVFFGSTQLSRLVQKIGNQHVTAIGAVFMASYPAWMAAADGPVLFLVGSACGGFGWSMAGGALANYLLEKIPGDDRPAYLAWYNLAINAAVLLGSLLGPVVGRYVGIPAALFLGGALRLVMAIVIWRWE